MCEMIVKQLYVYIYIYFCERGPLDSFVPSFAIFMIHLSGKGWTLKSPVAKWCHFITILFIKAVKIAKYTTNCESGITNVKP